MARIFEFTKNGITINDKEHILVHTDCKEICETCSMKKECEDMYSIYERTFCDSFPCTKNKHFELKDNRKEFFVSFITIKDHVQSYYSVSFKTENSVFNPFEFMIFEKDKFGMEPIFILSAFDITGLDTKGFKP